MRRALNNTLQPLKRQEDLSAVTQAYQDRGAMVLLDLCFWAGAKDVSIADYVETQDRHFRDNSYCLQLELDGKPFGYSFWEVGEEHTTIVCQSLPFGGHLSHLDGLKSCLNDAAVVRLDIAGTREKDPAQILW